MKIFVKHLNDKQIKNIKQKFEVIDNDKNGFISVEDF